MLLCSFSSCRWRTYCCLRAWTGTSSSRVRLVHRRPGLSACVRPDQRCSWRRAFTAACAFSFIASQPRLSPAGGSLRLDPSRAGMTRWCVHRYVQTSKCTAVGRCKHMQMLCRPHDVWILHGRHPIDECNEHGSRCALSWVLHMIPRASVAV